MSLPTAEGAGVEGLTLTRLRALWAATLSPDGPGVEIESLAYGLTFREGAVMMEREREILVRQ